ncbi:MAG: zinc-binding dehydrogenase, partial [Eubacteriales bacterium]
ESSRFDIARAFGADAVLNVQHMDPVPMILEKTEKQGADVVIDLSGSPRAIMQGFDLLRKDGRFCAIGIPGEPFPIDWQKLVLKAANIIFSYSSDYLSWERCLSMIENGNIKLKQFTNSVFKLSEWEKAFETARSGQVLKVIICPDEFV